MFSLVLLLKISLQLVASYNMCLPSYLFLYVLHSGNFEDPAGVGLAVLKKIIIF